MDEDASTGSALPCGNLALRISAMPANTNAAGDIFGGYIMGLMDMAAGNTAFARAQGRVATVAVSNLTFLRPVKVGDLISCYAEIVKVGRTSITIDIDVWVRRGVPPMHARVTQATFVMVAVDADGKPRPVPADMPAGALPVDGPHDASHGGMPL